jgi:hypothetical protein
MCDGGTCTAPPSLHPILQLISETVFLNFYGAQESIPLVCSLAGRYDYPIPLLGS